MSKLRSGINKIKKDEQKLKNRPVSQAVSPLTERVVNNNTNQKSLDMAGTQQSRQGVINQLAKDQEAVQQGALAQQQQTAEQQRAMQAQTVQQPMQPVEEGQPPQSIQDFRSEGLELAQQEAKEKIDQWQADMQSVAGFADRVPALVQEQLSAEAAEVGDFKINQDAINQIASQYATSTNADDIEDAKSALNGFLNIMQGVSPVDADGNAIYSDVNAMPSAMSYLISKAEDLNVDLDQIETFLTNTFKTLNISEEQQRTMVTTALADGVVDPENLTIGFIKKNLGKEVKLEDQFGVDEATLLKVLGTDYENMTVSEISDKIEEIYEENTLEISKLHKELKDPTISSGRKEEILREIQRRDASGITSMQAEAGRIKDRTAIADKLIIGGELKSIQDVLNDDNLKSLSDNLLTEIEAAGNDPTKINEAVDKFVKEYPEYADLASWVKDSYAEVTKRGEQVTSAIDLFKATAKESQEFIQNNEVFGDAGEGAKVILEALGFDIGDEDGAGLGILNNASNKEANAAYDVIKEWSEGNPDKFKNLIGKLQFLDAEDLEGIAGLIREEQVEEEVDLDGDGIPDVDEDGQPVTVLKKQPNNEDLIAALDMISSVDGMDDFRYLTGLNNAIATAEAEDNLEYTTVMSAIFPDDHPIVSMGINEINGYIEDLEALVDSKAKVVSINLAGEPTYLGEKELAEIQAIFDTDPKDGKIDRPDVILDNIKAMLPEGTGFNISNIDFGDDTNKGQELLNMLDDLDVEGGLTTALNNTVTGEYNKFEKAKSDYEEWIGDPANNPSITEDMQLYLDNPNAPGSEEAAENLDKAFPFTSDTSWLSGKTPSEIIKGGGSKAAFMKESLGFLNEALNGTKSISDITKEIMKYSSYQTDAWAANTYESLIPYLRGLGLDIQATGSKTVEVVDEWGLGMTDTTVSVVTQADIEKALTAWTTSKNNAIWRKQNELGYKPGDTNPMQDLYFDMNPAVAQALEG